MAKQQINGKQINGTWVDYTPTLVGLSGGILTYAKYNQTGKTIDFAFAYVVGASGVTAGVTISAPVTAASYNTGGLQDPIGFSGMRDVSASVTVVGNVFLSDVNTIWLGYSSPAGATVARNGVTATAPWTWATGDLIYCRGTYEAA